VTAPQPAERPRARRVDEKGRAYAGSQLSIQAWVNCRPEALAAGVLRGLKLGDAPQALDWCAPLADEEFAEPRDQSFLRAIKLTSKRKDLAAFWPGGGPVWDAVGLLDRGDRNAVILVEAKSYPAEVIGGGCKAARGGESRKQIERALDATATWLGISRPDSWMGKMYQSANRFAFVYFLREQLGIEAYMVNVCFTDDRPPRATSEAEWEKAHEAFREALKIEHIATPWLADVLLPALDRSELLALPVGAGAPPDR
jgi:hypothetical protein